MNAKYVRSGARFQPLALLTGLYATRKLKTMCEDYPCCGHAMGMCREESKGEGYYYAKFSNPNYDEYYDQD